MELPLSLWPRRLCWSALWPAWGFLQVPEGTVLEAHSRVLTGEEKGEREKRKRETEMERDRDRERKRMRI